MCGLAVLYRMAQCLGTVWISVWYRMAQSGYRMAVPRGLPYGLYRVVYRMAVPRGVPYGLYRVVYRYGCTALCTVMAVRRCVPYGCTDVVHGQAVTDVVYRKAPVQYRQAVLPYTVALRTLWPSVQTDPAVHCWTLLAVGRLLAVRHVQACRDRGTGPV